MLWRLRARFAENLSARRWLASVASSLSTKTFGNQHLLPRLPVPGLQESAAQYLASLKPLLSSDEHAKSTSIVLDFIKPDGVGELLQKHLKAFDAQQKHSWLEDAWLKYAYLIWRCPTMINVNYWCQFIDHPNHVLDAPPPSNAFTSQQLSRAAVLISNFLNVNEAINKEQLPPDTSRGKPLDMDQYKQLFGTTRIPKEGVDELLHMWPTTTNYIVVMAKDQIYRVPVLGSQGERVSVKTIENQLKNVIADVKRVQSSQQCSPPIGLLTSEDRDIWARARAALASHSSKNRDALTMIDQALFAVSLDDYTDSGLFDHDKTHLQFFHNYNAQNRWFDKTLSLIVTNSGRAGLSGEHTPADAVVPGDILNYALANEYPVCDPPNVNSTLSLDTAVRVEWDTTADMQHTIDEAREHAKTLIINVDSVVLHPKEYGADWIKKSAKCSPDSYVQMALQLAYYRDQHKVTATYESASTRMFLHGRTECVRSCSQQSKEFVEAWDRNSIERTHKLDLLQKAIQVHSQTMRSATLGNGCDRHFLGLRVMMQQNGLQPHAFFTDPAFALSSRFALSSSNMSPGKYIFGGFGPVVDDGYGVNYAIGGDDIGMKFSVSSWRSSQATDSSRFRNHLHESLQSMRRVIEG